MLPKFAKSSPTGAVVRYCNEHVSVYMCVCVSVCSRAYLPNHTAIFTIFVHVAYLRGSVLLRRGDEIPRGRGSFGFFAIDNALYGSCSGPDFAMKDQLGLNLLIYREVGHNSKVK